MDFEKLMNNVSDTQGVKEIEGTKETVEQMPQNQDLPQRQETADLLTQEDIQMSWTKVNISTWCGCNNACFHSCDNVR